MYQYSLSVCYVCGAAVGELVHIATRHFDFGTRSPGVMTMQEM